MICGICGEIVEPSECTTWENNVCPKRNSCIGPRSANLAATGTPWPSTGLDGGDDDDDDDGEGQGTKPKVLA